MKFYVYGGMKYSQNTKLHVADQDGKSLCGVTSFWMECTQEIHPSGFIDGEEHLFPIGELDCTCKKCLKKFTNLTKQ